MNERLTIIRRGREVLEGIPAIAYRDWRDLLKKWVHVPPAQSNSKLRANPAGARISPGPVGDSQKLQPESEPRGPFEDTLIDNPSRHTTPEPTGKMKYIHSEETLEIPEGGTVDLLRRL